MSGYMIGVLAWHGVYDGWPAIVLSYCGGAALWAFDGDWKQVAHGANPRDLLAATETRRGTNTHIRQGRRESEERMRNCEHVDWHGPGLWCPWCEIKALEAEVKRLRAENDRWRKQFESRELAEKARNDATHGD